MSTTWSHYEARMKELNALYGALGLMQWDQHVMMPPGGAAVRAEHYAILSKIMHEHLIDPAFGELVEELGHDLSDGSDPVRAAGVANMARKIRRSLNIPTELVQALAEANSKGLVAWMQARGENDFAPFGASLERQLALTREAIACQGPAAHPYDQLLEDFDPGTTTAQLRPMFERLGGELTAFVRSLEGTQGPAPLVLEVPEPALERLSRRIIAQLGFRMGDGRLDTSQHPFTSGMHPGDVRLTTHFYTDNLLSSLSGTIHEAGHGMYEQGLPAGWAVTGAMEAAGVGIHESQSRFWENIIARSLPFCRWLSRLVKEEIDADVSPELLYGASNRVRPSLIRVYADEVTYNLHIILRFELETALVSGDLTVTDLPAAWDDKTEDLLGIRPPDAVQGVLQDIHWSHGAFGYFPSYTIGNLYAASFAQAIEAALPDMWEQVEQGEFSAVLGWMRAKVHERGHLADAPRIFEDAVGQRDPVADLLAHLRARHGALYRG